MSFHTHHARLFPKTSSLEHVSEQSRSNQSTGKQSGRYQRWLFNGIIGVLLLSVVYFSYTLYIEHDAKLAEAQVKGFTPSGKPIQVDVLNGCGIAGAASKIAVRLRRHGFDVVEMRNYKSFDIRETLVIDRVGNLSQALQVASTLGVARDNVIQEINFDYFVDVTVVIGKDFESLH